MSRYIDIEPYEKDGWYLQKTYCDTYGAGVKTTPLISVPTADPEPKHAYAIIDEDGNMKCSNCGSSNCFDNYCGHCGAKIMGERKDDLEVAHCENCKYEDAGGGMTNRQYLATLSNEELANAIYDVIVDRIGWRYTSSKQGVSQWLGELYREDDFKKSTYYTDNKKKMDGERK